MRYLLVLLLFSASTQSLFAQNWQESFRSKIKLPSGSSYYDMDLDFSIQAMKLTYTPSFQCRSLSAQPSILDRNTSRWVAIKANPDLSFSLADYKGKIRLNFQVKSASNCQIIVETLASPRWNRELVTLIEHQGGFDAGIVFDVSRFEDMSYVDFIIPSYCTESQIVELAAIGSQGEKQSLYPLKNSSYLIDVKFELASLEVAIISSEGESCQIPVYAVFPSYE